MIRGRYLIVQMIGQGAKSDVYLAVDQRDGIAVALKRTDLSALDPAAGTLEREAVALTRLDHPVLPKVKEHFSESGHHFLVIEHISGENLADRLESSRKPFPVSWVMFWADQLLDALNYLHSHVPPILHGDVNPSNLKLTSDNHIVLLDCGLSPCFDRAVDMNATVGNEAGPSRHFPSPEQLRGARFEAPGDLYSLSASLYQLVTNTLPPDPMRRVDGISTKGSDPLMSPHIINKEVSESVAKVIVQGMALRPNERFTSAVEMQKELRKAFNLGTAPKGDETAVMPSSMADALKQEITVANTPVQPATDPLDATVHMGAGPGSEPPRQSDVRTEIFQVHETSPNRAPEPEPPPSPLESPQQVPATPAVPAVAAVAADPYPSQVTQIASVKKPKSSKAGLIFGVAIGLLLLAVVAAGAGLFMYKTYYSAPVAEASPTPEYTPVSTPAEVIASDDPVLSQEEPTPAVIEPPIKEEPETRTATTPEPERNVQQPRVTTRTTPAVSSRTPAQRATPKPPPVRDDRTVILQ